MIQVVNPQHGGATSIKYSRAMRYVRRGKAVMDSSGRMRFLYGLDASGHKTLVKGKPNMRLLVSEFSGLDAFPDRAVLPPSPSVLDAMRPRRGPLRPPMRLTSESQTA